MTPRNCRDYNSEPSLLSLSVNTLKTYRSRMMRKLGMDSLPDLVRFAIRRGLIPLD